MRADSRIKIIACQTVGEELKSILPENFEMTMLEYGLHNVPKSLHAQLQAEIDATSDQVDVILFGYGLCGNSVIGLKSNTAKMVFPKTYDCIALLLGSCDEYLRQMKQAPGTFYLSRGWIESGQDPYTEYCAMKKRYDEKKAMRVAKMVIKNYTRLAYIDSGNHQSSLESDRKYAKMVADLFDLNYEEIPGSNQFLKKFMETEWDDDFVIVAPGEEVRSEHFDLHSL